MDSSKRQTRYRRIMILVAVALGLVLVLGGVYVYQQSRKASNALARLAKADAAYDRGDLAQAIDSYSTYVSRVDSPSKPAMYNFAVALQEVKDRDKRNPAQALQLLKQVYEQDPAYKDAGQRLMNLYLLTGRDPVTLDIANQLLQQNPKNADALQAKAVVLSRLKRNVQALEFTNKALAQKPEDLRLMVMRFRLLIDNGTSPDDLVTQATELQEKNPENPNYALLLAFAHVLDNNRDQAGQWLRKCAQLKSPGNDYTNLLVRFLDSTGMYNQSMKVIQQQVRDSPQGGWANELVRRWFERTEYDKVIQQVSFDQKNTPADQPEQAMMLAVSLMHRGRQDRARQVLNGMLVDDASVYAKVLARMVRLTFSPDSGASEVIAAANDVLQVNPNLAYARFILGNARQSLNESESAIAAWDKAIAKRPGWAAPRISKAQLLLRQNKPREALAPAQAALTVQPSLLQAAIVLAQARAQAYDLSDPEQAARVMDTLDEIQKLVPDEPRTLLIKTRVALATDDRQTAAQAANRLINREPAAAPSVLVQLGSLVQGENLPLDADPYQMVKGNASVSIQITLAKAQALARAGKPDQGLAAIDQAMGQADPSRQDKWKIARARYLAAVNDPRAAQAWADLADANPDQLAIQQAALGTPEVWSNRSFVDRAIQRTRQITGDQGLAWRIERARYLLTGPTDQRDPRQALELLQAVLTRAPERVQPHLLIARAQKQMGNPTLAIRSLEQAARLRPQSNGIRMELAKLHQSQGDYQAAGNLLTRIAADPQARRDQRTAAAAALASQGNYQPAIAAIKSIDNPDPDTQRELISLYLRNGQTDQARQVIEQLLRDQSTPTASTIELASNVFIRAGDLARADQVLTRLDQTDADDATKQRIRAGHALRLGQFAKALDHLHAAIKADPTSAAAWRQLLSLEVSFGQVDALKQDLDLAGRRFADDPAFLPVARHADLIQLAASRAMLRPLASVLVQGDQAHTQSAIDALEIVRQTRSGSDDPVKLAQQLTTMADQNPGFLALRLVAAKLWLALGQPQRAASLAQSAREAFPAEPEPAAVAARALSQTGQWDSALVAAQDWRSRAPQYALPADQFIAAAQFHLNRSRDAIQTLTPYLDRALQDPDQFKGTIETGAQALTAIGQPNRARQLVEPLLSKGPQWRSLWIGVVANDIQNADVARTWLARVTRDIPDDTTELQRLARAWWSAGSRLNDQGMIDKGYQMLGQIVQRDDAGADAWFLRGAIAEDRNDLATAEASYRAALKLQPNAPVVKNNLTMVLVHRGGDLQDALKLAREANRAQPDNPNFLDTLATVQAKMGQYDQARQTIDQALRMDPNNPTWENTRRRINEMASAG